MIGTDMVKRFYKGQSARSYVLQNNGKLSTYNYWIKKVDIHEAIERAILKKGRVKYYRDGVSLYEWCQKTGKSYFSEYKKAQLSV